MYLSILFLCFSIYFTQDTPRRVDAIPSFGSSIDKSSTHGAFCVMEPEVWKDVTGFENYYQISSHGRLRSKDRIVVRKGKGSFFKAGRIIRPCKDTKGYLFYPFKIQGVKYNRWISILTAMEFVPNPDNKPYVGHLDNIPTNNYNKNLVWCTQLENVQHAYDCGRKKHKGKRITQIDLSGTPIRVFEKLKDVEILGFETTAVSAAARGLQKTSHGFRWKYADEIKTA